MSSPTATTGALGENGLHTLPIRPINMIQAVVTDLDGTLLRSDGTISSYTANALTRAQQHGLHIIFATARPLHSALRITDPVMSDSLIICSNGAVVYDPSIGRRSRVQPMRLRTVRAIVRYIRSHFPDAMIAVDCSQPRTDDPIRTLDPSWPDDWGSNIGDRALWRMDGDLPPPRAVICMMVLGAWQSHIEVPVNWPVTVTSSGHGLIEFSAPSANKLAALRWLCRQINVPISSVVAFGDMPNDAEVLEAAGLGVAVANAHEQAIAAARHVTASNDDDGVARFLDHLISVM